MTRLASLPLLLCLLLAAALAPAGARAQSPTAQEVRGNILDGETGASIEGAMVLLFDDAGKRVNGVLSGTSGFFRLFVPAPGRYRVRVERIGYANTDTETFQVEPGAVVQRRILTAVAPVELDQIDVAGALRCEVRPEGVATARVWEEARKALEAATWTADRGLYRLAWIEYERWLDAEGRRVIREQRSSQARFIPNLGAAIEPARLAEDGFVVAQAAGGAEYFAPDANVLLSDPFLDTHCFRLERRTADTLDLIGLAFEPIPGRGLADVSGVLWLEPETARLRSLEFQFVNHPFRIEGAGGELTFVELPNGTWIIREWRLRMPEVQEERDGQGRFRRYLVRGYKHKGAIVQRASTATGAVVIDETQSGVTGVVVDSAGEISQGTRVWVQGTAIEDTTDTDGRFSLPALGAGTWVVQSTGWPAEAFGYVGELEVTLGGAGMQTVRIQLPSLRDFAAVRCGDTTTEGRATLLGRVVDADGHPVPGAAVEITWPGVIAFDGRGVRGNREGAALFTDERGAFHQCGVPTGTGARGSATVEAMLAVQVKAVVDGLESPTRDVPIAPEATVVTATVVMPRRDP